MRRGVEGWFPWSGGRVSCGNRLSGRKKLRRLCSRHSQRATLGGEEVGKRYEVLKKLIENSQVGVGRRSQGGMRSRKLNRINVLKTLKSNTGGDLGKDNSRRKTEG